jgi:hypothetical protein
MNDPETPSEPRMKGKSAARQAASDGAEKRAVRDNVSDRIGEQVVRLLGSPTDLLDVRVCPLWGDRYRVNVFVGKDFTSGRVADSFFLVADDDGKILSSTPAIARLY